VVLCKYMYLNGVLPWLVRWARRAGIRGFFLPWLKIFFLTAQYFTLFVPIAQPGRLVFNGAIHRGRVEAKTNVFRLRKLPKLTELGCAVGNQLTEWVGGVWG
jgi:hypothetical protein